MKPNKKNYKFYVSEAMKATRAAYYPLLYLEQKSAPQQPLRNKRLDVHHIHIYLEAPKQLTSLSELTTYQRNASPQACTKCEVRAKLVQDLINEDLWDSLGLASRLHPTVGLL